MQRQVRSFDVFDTVLTRRVGAPAAVFPLVAERLRGRTLLPVPNEVFRAAREGAERSLNARRGRPTQLGEIYAEVLLRLSLPRQHLEAFQAVELDVERELSVPVPGIAAIVKDARSSSSESSLVFVSDTPHPEEFIAELLGQAGLLEPGDRVYASASRGVSKSGGGLLALVAGDVNDADARFEHHGDNSRSDVAGARVEGWSACHRPQARLTRYEEILEEDAAQTAGLSSWLAGASRRARLEMYDRGVPTARADVACGVVAPLLAGFALWVAAQARERGVRRLYFAARDGEILLDVARPLLAAIAPELECRYLYGSRQAWVFAASQRSPESLADWVTVRQDFTVRSALARVALTPEDVWAVTRPPMFDPARADEPMGAEDRRTLAAELQVAPLLDLVRDSAAANAQATVAYLRQEGLADGVPSALVDVGWNGVTAQAFDHLVASAGGAKLPHLVLGVFAAARAARMSSDPPDLTAWLFDDDLGRGPVEEVPGPNVVVEMFCAGTEGRVQHYRSSKDGRVSPVLSSPHNDPVLEWGLPAIRDAVGLFTDHVIEILQEQHLHFDVSRPVWRCLHAFWVRPTDEEVAQWGSFPWEEETWPPYYPVAQSLGTADVLARLARGDRRIRRHNSWRAGSARVSAQPWRAILQARAWHERNATRLHRVPRWIRLQLAGRRPD